MKQGNIIEVAPTLVIEIIFRRCRFETRSCQVNNEGTKHGGSTSEQIDQNSKYCNKTLSPVTDFFILIFSDGSHSQIVKLNVCQC